MNDPAKQAWQASVEIAGAPPLEEVRTGVNRFYRFISWRNGIEYVACAIGAVSFSVYVFTTSHLFQKVGSVMIVAAIIFVAWQLHRRAGAMAPEDAGTMPLLAFSRAQMVRQRDALRGLFWWYILPLLPGMLVFLLGTTAAKRGETTTLVMPGWPEWTFIAAMAAFIALACWLNIHFAGKLQKHIDEIDALTGEGV
jgi:hypothetical protein